jgi:hypothetical protein
MLVLVASSEDAKALSWGLRQAMEVFVLENKAAGEENVAKEIEKVLDAIRALSLSLSHSRHLVRPTVLCPQLIHR